MKKSYIKYIAALLLFGLNGIVASRINLKSAEIVLLRTLIGSLLLIAIFFLTRQKPTAFKHKKDFMFIAISGVAMGASWMFLYEAYSCVGVSIASLLYYCGPVAVMILAPIVFKERLTAVKIAGFAAVLCGIFFVNGNFNDGAGDKKGIICGLLSAAMYSVMVITNKKSENVHGMENSVIQLAVSFLTVAVYVGLNSGYHLKIDSADWVWILILGLLNTGIGCYFYFSSIGNLPVQTVAVCGYLEPLSAVLFSVILLNEKMTLLQVFGAVLIIGGALFGECFKRKKAEKKDA